MKRGWEAILDQRSLLFLALSLCSLSHPTAGYYRHMHILSHTQNKTKISMIIVFQPVGVTKQGDHSAFLTGEGRLKVFLNAGSEESSVPPVRPQNPISLALSLEASWHLGRPRGKWLTRGGLW